MATSGILSEDQVRLFVNTQVGGTSCLLSQIRSVAKVTHQQNDEMCKCEGLVLILIKLNCVESLIMYVYFPILLEET